MVDTASRPSIAEPATSTGPIPLPSARIDVESLGRQLLGTWADVRLAARAMVG